MPTAAGAAPGALAPAAPGDALHLAVRCTATAVAADFDAVDSLAARGLSADDAARMRSCLVNSFCVRQKALDGIVTLKEQHDAELVAQEKKRTQGLQNELDHLAKQRRVEVLAKQARLLNDNQAMSREARTALARRIVAAGDDDALQDDTLAAVASTAEGSGPKMTAREYFVDKYTCAPADLAGLRRDISVAYRAMYGAVESAIVQGDKVSEGRPKRNVDRYPVKRLDKLADVFCRHSSS
eukprot:94260-Prymnesium_polylepis.1